MGGQNGGIKIGKWFQDTWHHYQEHKAQEKMLHQIIEQVVEFADPYIRQAKRYQMSCGIRLSGLWNIAPLLLMLYLVL